MRKTGLLVTALSACVGLSTSALAQSATNLVINGSFEGPTGVAPVGWTVGGTAGDGALPVAIAYNQSSNYPYGAQGEVVPQDNATSKSPDPAGQNAVYFVSDAAINLSLSQKVYLTAGSHAIGFDSYDTFNGAVQTYDAELTATIAGVKLADFFASSVAPGVWTSHEGVAYITQAGYYDVDFVFNADTFPAKDILIDRAYVISVTGSGGTPIGGVPPLSIFDHWDGSAIGNANNGVVDGGPGVWNATNANWTTATGAVNGAYAPNAASLVFSGAPGTVTIDNSAGQVMANGLTFNVDGYHLAGDALELTGTNATIAVGDGTAVGAGFTATIDAVLTGSAGLTKTDAGTLVLTNANTYTGGTTIAAGSLFAQASGLGTGDIAIAQTGTLVIDQPADATLANMISGNGIFVKTGAAALTITGDNPFTGATMVANGTLAVTGNLGGSVVTVGTGATLSGNGVVGGVSALSGSTIAIGAAIGTLSVNNNFHQSVASTYAVKLTSAGASDLVNVTGSAAIDGGANLVVTKIDSGAYVLGTRYTVLTAAGGLNGQYTVSGDTAVSYFYNLVGDYDAHNVYLDVAQTKSFVAAAITPNQISTAIGADSVAGAVHDAIGNEQTAAAAQADFNALSGEIHATVRAAAFEDSRFIREAINDQLITPTTGLWFHGFGSWGHRDGDGNATYYRRNIGGFFMGADVIDSGPLRIGLVGGYSHSTLTMPSRSSTATADDGHVGAFASLTGGPLALRAGGTYTFRTVKTDRSVNLAGSAEQLDDKYQVGIGQGFAEAAYTLKIGPVGLSPFAAGAYVDVSNGRSREGGGAAALDVNPIDTGMFFTTLGGRLGADLLSTTNTTFSLKAMGGWRHASDHRDVAASLAFVGGNDFTVDAVPIAKDVAALELSLVGKMRSGTLFSVSYSGQHGDHLRDDGIKASLHIPL